jgi:hypothetical protein
MSPNRSNERQSASANLIETDSRKRAREVESIRIQSERNTPKVDLAARSNVGVQNDFFASKKAIALSSGLSKVGFRVYITQFSVGMTIGKDAMTVGGCGRRREHDKAVRDEAQ